MYIGIIMEFQNLVNGVLLECNILEHNYYIVA